jgi:hypothetical protein
MADGPNDPEIRRGHLRLVSVEYLRQHPEEFSKPDVIEQAEMHIIMESVMISTHGQDLSEISQDVLELIGEESRGWLDELKKVTAPGERDEIYNHVLIRLAQELGEEYLQAHPEMLEEMRRRILSDELSAERAAETLETIQVQQVIEDRLREQNSDASPEEIVVAAKELVDRVRALIKATTKGNFLIHIQAGNGLELEYGYEPEATEGEQNG